MSDYTTFVPGSVAATNSAAQELRFGSLAYYQSALDQFCQNLEASFKFAKDICDKMEEAAKHERTAAQEQAAGTIASGAIGVAGGAYSAYKQSTLSKELREVNKANQVAAGLSPGDKAAPAAGVAPQPPPELPPPGKAKEIELELQNLQTFTHLGRSIGELVQGTLSMFSAEERYKAAMEAKDQKWFENCQQALSRFLDLLKEQRQLTTQLMDDAKRAHELIIQAATSRG